MKTYIVASAIVNFKDTYLIGKRASTKKVAPNQWEFISGFIEDHVDAEETILTELKEEVNVRGKIKGTSDPLLFNENNDRWIIVPFFIEALSNKVNRNVHDHDELLWVKKEQLLHYEGVSDIFKELRSRELL